MLSSCWLTSPFSGCFNTAIKGVVGGAHDASEAASSRARMSQAPPAAEKTLINGSAGGGGFPPAGIGSSSAGVRNTFSGGGVTTIAPKASAEHHFTSSGQPEKVQPEPQQPQTPPMESEMEAGDDKFMKRTYKSEYRKKFRPFSQYQYVDGKFHKAKAEGETGNAWYKEVLELRRQAGQYRCRGWGVETASDRMAEIYNKQVELWEQVSRRSSLQALSLASATPSRPISKAEKEIENSRRSSPIKHVRDRPSTAPSKAKPAPVHKPTDKTDGKLAKDIGARHHYEKTTGAGDGFLITSPSRDRIEPIVNTDWSTRRSPRKTPPITSPVKDGASKRRPPRAASLARASSAKAPSKSPSATVGKKAVSDSSSKASAPAKTDAGRSVSVGPENRSPKRTSRPPSSTHAPTPATKERRPRPTSLSTSSRRKGTDSALPHPEGKRSSKKILDITTSPKRSADIKSKEDKKHSSEEEDKKDKEGKEVSKDSAKDSLIRKTTPEPRFAAEKYEPVVKTPPEPTRVKSPDQVMVKSPDPVNWTVPLDTGKTFTVTHNIPEGETSRGTPSSEHRPPLESRSRQTPEPTKIYQGSLAGTPITTAGTGSAAPSATTATASATSAPPQPTKTESVPATKTTSSAAPVPTSTPPVQPTTSSVDKAKEPVSGDFPAPSVPTSDTKPSSKKDTDSESARELPSTTSVETKSLSSIKETSPQPPPESSKPYQETPKQPDAADAKTSSPASSISSSVGLSSGPAQDPMTMSVFGSINGVNGKSSGSPSPTKPEVPLPEISKKEEVKPLGPRTVPGSSLKCLDDPNFLNDKPISPVAPKSAPGYKVLDAPEEPISTKPGNYRVLEAPGGPTEKKTDSSDPSPSQPSEVPPKPAPYRVLEAPIDPPSRPKGSPYRVLEAPDAPFSASSQPVGTAQDSKPPSLVSPSSGRTVTDALDKARTRFDSFWGGGKDKDPPSKV